jgi:hypothetical protein
MSEAIITDKKTRVYKGANKKKSKYQYPQRVQHPLNLIRRHPTIQASKTRFKPHLHLPALTHPQKEV